MRALLVAALLVVFPGCLTQVPVDKESKHRRIDWSPDFDAARARATSAERPILLVMVAGEIDDRC